MVPRVIFAHVDIVNGEGGLQMIPKAPGAT